MGRSAFAGLVAAVAIAISSPAAADEPALPPGQIDVIAEGVEDADLQERVAASLDPEAGWRSVCRLPCHMFMTADPAAQHRIVDGSVKKRVHLGGGPRVVVTYERAPSWRGPLLGGSTVVAAGGSVALGTGLVLFVANIPSPDPPPNECGMNTACNQARAAEKADSDAKFARARNVMAIGLVTLLVGGAGIVAALVGAKPSTSVVARDAASASKSPQPSWSRAELPRPPNHVMFVNLRF